MILSKWTFLVVTSFPLMSSEMPVAMSSVAVEGLIQLNPSTGGIFVRWLDDDLPDRSQGIMAHGRRRIEPSGLRTWLGRGLDPRQRSLRRHPYHRRHPLGLLPHPPQGRVFR
jgi:hypothetical protein